MKLSVITNIIMAGVVCASVSSCKFFTYTGEKESAEYNREKPSEYRVTKEFTVGAFDEISTEGMFDVTYIIGEPSVSVTIAENKVDEIVVKVVDNELVIKNRHRRVNLGKVEVSVSSPVLDGISIAGAGTFTAENGISAREFDASISGAGKMTITSLETTGDADFSIAGAGSYELRDIRCGDIDVQIAGSGKVFAENVRCMDCDLGIAGSGDINISGNAAGDCEVTIAGSGKIDIARFSIAGSFSKDIGGSGKIIR